SCWRCRSWARRACARRTRNASCWSTGCGGPRQARPRSRPSSSPSPGSPGSATRCSSPTTGRPTTGHCCAVPRSRRWHRAAGPGPRCRRWRTGSRPVPAAGPAAAWLGCADRVASAREEPVPASVRKDDCMRIYLPATSADLSRPAGVPPRWGHAVTGELRRALPEEDEEGLEASAMLAAADESIVHLRAAAAALPLRVVIAADVADSSLVTPERARPWRPGDDQLPSAVDVRATVPWQDVVSIHVDDPAAGAD